MTTPTAEHAQTNLKGTLTALTAAIVLALTGIFIRILTDQFQMPPLILAFWRNLFTVIFLVLALLLIKPALLRFPQGQFGFLLGFGLVLALFNSLWTTAIAETGAAIATVLAYTSGAFTAILGRWLLNEKLYIGKWIAILCCFGGVVLISGLLTEEQLTVNLGGVLIGASSGLMYAANSVIGRFASQRQLNPWNSLLYALGFATLILFGFNLGLSDILPGTAQTFADFFWLGDAWQGWVVLVILAAGPTLVGYGLYNVSLSLLPSSVANLLLTTEPPLTALIAYIFLGERLTAVQIGGSLLILIGVLFLRVNPQSKRAPRSKTI